MQKRSIKEVLVTDTLLIVIILMVYFTAFIGGMLLPGRPVFRGSAEGDMVGLQIAVGKGSNVEEYIAVLKKYEISATFFFENSGAHMKELIGEEHSTGYLHSTEAMPVMSYSGGSEVISTSIDLDKLRAKQEWEGLLEEKVACGMLLFVSADNNLYDFEKIVQIILDKGYTIVRMEEMFTKEN